MPPVNTPTPPTPKAPPAPSPSGETPDQRPHPQLDQALYLSLPLPLSHLYSRTFTSKTARARHDNAYYLFEALIKLAACPPIAAYCRGTALGQPRDPALDRSLLSLRLPSVGHWLGLLRQTAKHFAAQPDHPLSPLHHALSTNRYADDHPALLALYRAIKHGPDAPAAKAQACSLLDLFDALTQYRNAVFGHGGPRPETFYEQQMAPLLCSAAQEALAPNILPILGPEGTQLLHLRQVRETSDTRRELDARELAGQSSQRLPPIPLTPKQADALTADGHPLPAVAVHWPGHAPLRLDPLVRFREYEVADDAVLLNRDRKRKHVEYLSYATGRTERDADAAQLLGQWLARAADEEATAFDAGPPGSPGSADTSIEDSTAPPSYAVEPGRTLGDYNLLAEIGRGGMGVVYLAEQRSLRRQVALKTLPRELHDNANLLTRFRREMRVLGSCDHPNIVKLLDSGVLDDGTVYYTMEYIAGCDLNAVWQVLSKSHARAELTDLSTDTFNDALQSASLKARNKFLEKAKTQSPGLTPQPAEDLPVQKPLTPPPLPTTTLGKRGEDDYARRIVQLIRDAADALDTVHQRGIVHRDISPGNLMLTPDGSRVVLMDFGLAKGQDVSVELSVRGAFAGKYRYAAPEQYAEGREPITAAIDVRGLGVTLWELLTRRRLFADRQTPEALTAAVTRTDVPRLRSIDPTFDRDLDAIVARACERDVNDRIPSAGLLRDYLQMYLDGTPLPIRPPGLGEMARRWAKENRGIVYASAAGLALALLLTVAAFFAITQQRNQALDNFQTARNTVSQFFRTIATSPAFYDDATSASQRNILEGVIASYSRLLDTYSGQADVQSERVQAVTELAAVEARIGNHDRVLEHTQQALDTLDTLSDTSAHSKLRTRLLNQRARAHLARRELTPGIAAARAALAAEPQDDPAVALPDIAAAHLTLADLHHTAVDFASAAQHYLDARQQFDTLHRDAADDPRLLDDWARSTLALAQLYHDEKRTDRAEPLFAEVADRIADFQDRQRPTSQLIAARATANRFLTGYGRPSFAKARRLNALITDLERLAGLDGAPPRYQTELAYARIARGQHTARFFAAFQNLDNFPHPDTPTRPALTPDQALRDAAALLAHDFDPVLQTDPTPSADPLTTEAAILQAVALMRYGTSRRDLITTAAAATTSGDLRQNLARASLDDLQRAIDQIDQLIADRAGAGLPPDFGLLYQRTNVRARLAYTLYTLRQIPTPDRARWAAYRNQYTRMTQEGQDLISLNPTNTAARALYGEALFQAGLALHPIHDTDDRLDRFHRALDTLKPLATPDNRVAFTLYMFTADAIASTALEASRPDELRAALTTLRASLAPWLMSTADHRLDDVFTALNSPDALPRLATGELQLGFTPAERRTIASNFTRLSHFLNRYLITSAALRLAPPPEADNTPAQREHFSRVRDAVDGLVTLWGDPDELPAPTPDDPFRTHP
ncbi:MAG: serine/threonine-protein kinase [Planctomycetota bacterium]